MKRIVGDSGDLLYFTEEGGIDAGIHARDASGRFYTVLESPVYRSETTGLSFSPDGIHLYVAYQDVGYLFDVWREDGLPFQGRTLNVKYHERRFLD
jgi:sugar lactone lactonase YvrE